MDEIRYTRAVESVGCVAAKCSTGHAVQLFVLCERVLTKGQKNGG